MSSTKRNLGFANMDKDQQREIASQGGRVAHEKGVAHEFTPEEAREAGRKGGRAVSRNREHMAAIGRLGAKAKAEKSRLRGTELVQENRSPGQDVFQILKDDHETVNDIFTRISEIQGQDEARTNLFPQLRRELEQHAKLEEQHVYPALESREETRDLALQAREEHATVKKLLTRIDSLKANEEGFEALITELRSNVTEHVREEESVIFAKMREVFDQRALDQISTAAREFKGSSPAQEPIAPSQVDREQSAA